MLVPDVPPIERWCSWHFWGCWRLRTHRLVLRKCSAEFMALHPVSLPHHCHDSLLGASTAKGSFVISHALVCPALGLGQVASCSSLGHRVPLPCSSFLWADSRERRGCEAATTGFPSALAGLDTLSTWVLSGPDVSARGRGFPVLPGLVLCAGPRPFSTWPRWRFSQIARAPWVGPPLSALGCSPWGPLDQHPGPVPGHGSASPLLFVRLHKEEGLWGTRTTWRPGAVGRPVWSTCSLCHAGRSASRRGVASTPAAGPMYCPWVLRPVSVPWSSRCLAAGWGCGLEPWSGLRGCFVAGRVTVSLCGRGSGHLAGLVLHLLLCQALTGPS